MIDTDKLTNDIMQKMSHDNLTIGTASRAIGISQKVLRRIEEGGKPLNITTLEKLLKWLGEPMSAYVN